jgi:hypothetical protein
MKRVAIARNEDHIIDARECPLQSRGILIVQTTARPTWPVAPVTRIIMPLHVPA